MPDIQLTTRLRRLRQTPALRQLLQETKISHSDMVYPLFINENISEKQAVSSMPGVYQHSLSSLKQEIKEVVALQIPAVILFGIPKLKDDIGSSALNDNGIIQQAIQEIKSIAPQLLVITDLCFCEYTSHGHCGVLDRDVVDNDATLPLLAEQAISHAKAGADIIAPSGMMDGMVASIRQGLDSENFKHISILSYAVKYASAFYGPFREAAEGAPQFGDRSQYQMDYANRHEALREAQLDVEEGADMLMVKPAMCYLDIISQLKQNLPQLPLSAYQVSGEYSLIKFGAKQGLIDEKAAMIESLTAIKRAGANFIINYFAKDMCKVLDL